MLMVVDGTLAMSISEIIPLMCRWRAGRGQQELRPARPFRSQRSQCGGILLIQLKEPMTSIRSAHSLSRLRPGPLLLLVTQ